MENKLKKTGTGFNNCSIVLDVTNINAIYMELFDILNDNIRFTIEQHNLYVLFLDIVIKKILMSGDVFH